MFSPEAFLIAMRESLEAFLIVSILAGLVVKLGHPEAKRSMYLGVAAALGVSVLAGALVMSFTNGLSDAAMESFEGIAALAAVAILTYMVFWMYRHTIGLVAKLRDKAKAALDAGKPAVLFSLAFVAVVREGFETVVFFGTLAPTTGWSTLMVSAVIGIAASAVLAALMFRGVVHLSLRRFFGVTGVILILFAGGLFMTAVHEFAEVGALPETATAWNTEWLLDQHGMVGAFAKAIVGYREAPTVLEAGVYVAYVFGLGAWYIRGLTLAGRRPTGAPEGA